MAKRIFIIIIASALICGGYYFYLESTNPMSKDADLSKINLKSAEDEFSAENAPIKSKDATEVAGQPAIGGIEFTLTDQNGYKVSDKDLLGKKQIIFFGFTHCPSICPVSLAVISEAINQLEAEGINDVTPVFISVDPERDKPEVIKTFLEDYHNKFIGLTGTKEEITRIKKAYKVYAERAETTDNAGGDHSGHEAAGDEYLMDHSDLIYLMDEKGNYVAHFTRDNAPEDIVEYITK